MKFRARLVMEELPQMIRVLQALERTADRVIVLHLPDAESSDVRFVVRQDMAGAASAYAAVGRQAVFADYRIQSKNGNNIGLELEAANLIRTLKSAAEAQDVTVRLSKKDVEVLTFEFHTAMGAVTQAVPARVLSAAQLSECRPPTVQAAPGFMLPFAVLRYLCSKADKMRMLDGCMRLEAHLAEICDLEMTVENAAVSMVCTLDSLARADASRVELRNDGPKSLSAAVETRQLSRALFGYHAIGGQPGAHMLACSCYLTDTCVRFTFPLETCAGSLQYYIPILLE
mmetsp:Transcript_6353/g.16947  ORF Transcript_6353/g.16947 Transcript_6353/m.16947 type:complete len:286 (+) Transcript_6353:210-1067(+)